MNKKTVTIKNKKSGKVVVLAKQPSPNYKNRKRMA